MTVRKQKAESAPSPDAATPTPFFARFLEDQTGDAEAKAPAEFMTLKYPSDRDEIDWYAMPQGNAADAR